MFLDIRKKPINSGHAIRFTLVSQCTKREKTMASDENCMTILVDEEMKNETKANEENQDSTMVNGKERKTRKSGKKFKHEIKEKGNCCAWMFLIKSSLDAIIAKLQATLKDKQATIDNKDRELKLQDDKIKMMGKEKANLIF